MFNRKKRLLEKLNDSFGAIKTEGFNFDLIKRYHFNLKHTEAQQFLSEQTCDDLDFDVFFAIIDRTTSKVGQQYLYSKTRTINYLRDQFKRQEMVIQHLKENPQERLKIQYQLHQLNTDQAYYIVDLFQQELNQKPPWYYLIPILSASSFLSLVLSFIYPAFLLVFFFFFAINMLVHYGLKRKTNVFIHAIPSLLVLGAVAKNLFKFECLKSENTSLTSSLTTLSEIRRKMSFFKLEQKVDSDIEAAYWYLLELLKITFLLEPLLLFSSMEVLRFKAKEIEHIYRFVGETDAILSVASLRFGLDSYCIPTLSEDTRKVHFTHMQHPLIPDCVANDVNFEKSVLLTGSNMSGKTTYIRAIGLNVVAGITLNTCFATSASIPNAQLFSVIRIEDDLMSSSSYFLREVDEMKKVIDQTKTGNCSIVLLDELFKGTNTRERIASAKAILSFLAQQNCQVFVSTHDIELTSLLKDQFELVHFSETVSDNNIHFDYKLKQGVPENGNAIRILEMSGYPENIIREAQSQLINEALKS